MSINIHGKEYVTVKERVDQFRSHADFSKYSIETEVLSAAELVQIKATIKTDGERVIATGHAEELRGSTNINKTSALENCETSAIGRALASLGLGGEQFATANEVGDAMIQQAQKEVAEVFYKHNKAVFDNIHSLIAIRSHICDSNMSLAKECWLELGEDIQNMVWRAPTKGGYWTTSEREIIKNGFKEQ